MRSVELRSLIKGEPKIVIADPEFEKIYNIWREIFISKTGREPNEKDIFYAGYVLSNPSVRDMYKRFIVKEHESRIN